MANTVLLSGNPFSTISLFLAAAIILLLILFFLNIQKSKRQLLETTKKLKSTQQQLIMQEKLASLGQMTAGIAHEIQNPLNFVNNFSEVCGELVDEFIQAKTEIERNEIGNDLKSSLEKIHHHGSRADSIVKGILMHSRTGVEEKVLTDINVLCDEALNLSYHSMRASSESFNCEIEKKLAPDLPKAKVIPQDISRVFLNLFGNAFYAVKNNNGNAKISVESKLNGSSIIFLIKDNGSGVPENVKEKLFIPFYTTKPSGEGTGLGLSISFDIMKSHGGDLKLINGNATIFEVSLPVS